MEYAAATADGPLIHTWNLPDWVTAHSCAAAHNSSAVVAVPSDFRPLADELADLERTRMHQALLAASGVQLRAAELLRMPERTFYMKAKQYGLVTKSRRPSAD
jgi:DNA-binding NtrC family response regulator